MKRRLSIALVIAALFVGLGAFLWQSQRQDRPTPGSADALDPFEPGADERTSDEDEPADEPAEQAHDGPALRFVDSDGTDRAVEAVVGAPGLWPPVEAEVGRGRLLSLPEVEASTLWGEPAVSYEVLARDEDGGFGFWSEISLDDLGDDDLRLVELDEASPLRVRVVGPDQSPIAGADVRLSRELVGLVHVSGATGADGTAALQAIPRGDYRLSVRAPGFVQHTRHLLHTGAGATVEVELDHGATVTGRVAEASGAGLPQATVEIIPVSPFHDESLDAGFLAQVGVASQIASAGPGGDFSVAGIEAGAIRVRVDAPGYVPALSALVRVRRGAVIDVGEVELRRGQRVEARVVDEDGEPVEGATVRWRAPNSELSEAALSDSEGRATLDGMPPMATISAELDEWTSAEVTPGRPDDSGAIPVELVLRRPEELPDLMVRVLGEDDRIQFEQVVLVGRTDHGRQRCRGERVDTFDWRFEQCAPGEMTLEASTDDHGTATLRGEFDEATEVTIAPPVDVEVRFGGLQGPQWDASASRWRAAGGPWRAAGFDTETFDERVWSHALFEGRYQIEFDSPATGAVRESFVVADAPVTVEVELSSRQQVELYVVDATGSSVSGALMQVWQGDRRVFEAQSRGAEPVKVELPSPFDGALVAFDGRRGEGRVPIELGADGNIQNVQTEYVARLDEELFTLAVPPGRVRDVGEIERILGAELVGDNNAWLVDVRDRDAPAARAGIERGDRLVWLRRASGGYAALIERGDERSRVEVPAAD